VVVGESEMWSMVGMGFGREVVAMGYIAVDSIG
jgi:hypothetical protein